MGAPLRADDAAPGLNDVLSVLDARCAKCHNSQKRSGKLVLTGATSLARGGESGEVVAAGDPDSSLLWQRIDSDDMPPDAPLSGEERALVRQWIAAGAHGLPSSAEVGHAGDGADHWAFQTPQKPPVPVVRDESFVGTDVDRFVQARLEQAGLSLGPEANRATLIRRVSFDLTGLPPTPDEIAAFLADAQSDAYDRMVERYLASPHYGERWGRHWLDAAGYADSNGYFNADTDRPLAFRYRDYVIRSMNDDKPFNRFLTEQIAGDELAGYRPEADVTPDVVDLYVATHFLRNSQDGTDSSDGNADELLLDRFSVLEGTVQIIGSSLLGLTLQCARCHDHKFEPVSQREYYQLQAILFPAYSPDNWQKAAQRTLAIGTRAERAAHAEQVAKIDTEISALRESFTSAQSPLRTQLIRERLGELDETARTAILAANAKSESDRNDEEKSLLKSHDEALKVTDEQLDTRFAELSDFRKAIDDKIKMLEGRRPAPLEQISVLTEVTDEPSPHHVLLRGAYRDHGDEVEPSVPAVLCKSPHGYSVVAKSAGQYSSGRRTALARWLTDPAHPLVARITVNRIWQHHFGQGIVASSDNFGYTGAEPTHPELLDYLATTFIESGWSTKDIHRCILRSRTYRQSSAPQPQALSVDPSNTLLWRYPITRLDAEAIRDAMLATSGLIDRAMLGPYVPTNRAGDGTVTVAADHPQRHRRSLYLQQRRTQLPSLLEVFDAPSMVTSCPRRPTSTVTLQSLALLNAPMMLECADAFAQRVIKEAAPGDDQRLSHAFLLAFGRMPSVDERQLAAQFLVAQATLYASQPDSQQLAWRDLCQMLLSSNQFLYVE